MSLRHMHHCMSMNALEQGLLGLEAAKASDIDDFVHRSLFLTQLYIQRHQNILLSSITTRMGRQDPVVV